MAFEPGHKKLGGRKKGVSNKLTSIQDGLNAAGFDFWDGFKDEFEELDGWQKMQVRKWLAEYLFLKPKSDDMPTDDLERALDEVRVLLGHRKERDVV